MSLSEGADVFTGCGASSREGMAECTRNWVAELALASFPGGEVWIRLQGNVSVSEFIRVHVRRIVHRV